MRVGIEITGDPAPIARDNHGAAALTAVRQFAAKHGGRLENDPAAAYGDRGDVAFAPDAQTQVDPRTVGAESRTVYVVRVPLKTG